MIRRRPALSSFLPAVLALSLAVSGCGSSSGGNANPSPNPPVVPPATPSGVKGLTVFNQAVPARDGEAEVFPGHANVWEIGPDFGLADGGGFQFWPGALVLSIDGAVFPPDQSYAELTFRGPEFGAADGVVIAAVDNGTFAAPLTGAYTALLNATADSRLRQTLNLTGAVAPVTLSWQDNVSMYRGAEGIHIPIPDPAYRVVVIDAADNAATTVFSATTRTSGTHTEDLSGFAGRTVVLSFELRTNGGGYARIDNVSVRDNAAVPAEYVKNGGFETGSLSEFWTVNAAREPRHVTSGERGFLADNVLKVTRSFYSPPGSLWGRWVDVFRNDGAASVTVTASYLTTLGSLGCGVIYPAPGTGNGALTAWDRSFGSRDVGLVFGGADGVSFLSDAGTGPCTGSDNITLTHTLAVPAGGRKAVVHFVIMDGFGTGAVAMDNTARADRIDAEAAGIVGGFRNDSRYRQGMTQTEVDAIVNF